MKQMFIRLLLAASLALGLVAAAAAETVSVAMKTSLGDLELELYPDQAPETVANFLRYVDEGFYNGTIFHRVISGFMIQGADLPPIWNASPLTIRSGMKHRMA